MCILMMIHQGVAGYPIVLAANRDEYYDRPSAGPQLLQQFPRVWGGRDVRAGGVVPELPTAIPALVITMLWLNVPASVQ